MFASTHEWRKIVIFLREKSTNISSPSSISDSYIKEAPSERLVSIISDFIISTLQNAGRWDEERER